MKKHNRVDYIKNCVEETLKRKVGQAEYAAAVEKSYSVRCLSMADRINAIVRCLR